MRLIRFLLPVLVLALTAHLAYKKREQISLWWALQQAPPTWAKEQIAQDLAPFQSSRITQVALDQTFDKILQHPIPAYRYRILDGNIFRKPESDPTGRAAVYDKILKRIQKSQPLPDVDFILCVMDGVPEVYVPSDFWITESQAPLLCWAKKKNAPALVLVPDFLTTRESGWHRDIATIEQTYQSTPWECREPKAFWRGAASDKIYTAENYVQKPRFQISSLSAQYPECIDAGFCRATAEILKLIPPELLVGHRSLRDHLSYKYLPVLDGWMCTFPGFQWRLLSGSLPFKQESDEVQYFYSALRPFVHYLPIRNDMGDLLEKVEWAKQHDLECQTIVQNARSFALANLWPNQVYAYLYWVLTEYHTFQAFPSFSIDGTWKKV